MKNTNKHNNRRILIFGRPGSGKTTLAVLEMLKALREGYYVYSNIQINWFGDLFALAPIHGFINRLYANIKRLTYRHRINKYSKLIEKKEYLTSVKQGVHYDGNGVPSVNLTKIYYDLYWIEHDLKKIENINDNMVNGWIKEHYYEPQRYTYTESLEEAIEKIISQAELNPNQKYLLAFDEGFIELDHNRKVPPYITNFFNQSRKLQCDVIVSSQRPVAVYPSFRALCDYMVLVEKTWFGWFNSKKYFVDDDANALPDLSKDAEGKDKGKDYITFRGKQVYPFFDTRQSIGLMKLFNRQQL